MSADDEAGASSIADDELDALEIVSQNRWYVLAETADGYGIWTHAKDFTEPPLATFGEDEQGFRDADNEFRRRTRRMRVFAELPQILAWVVAVSVILWVIAIGITALATLTNVFGSQDPTSNFSATWPQWVEGVVQFSYALWLGSLGLMVMLWLLRRAREEPYADA